jgi:hypothetical protein
MKMGYILIGSRLQRGTLGLAVTRVRKMTYALHRSMLRATQMARVQAPPSRFRWCVASRVLSDSGHKVSWYLRETECNFNRLWPGSNRK